MTTLELPNTRILSTNIRPEMQMILCCARPHIDDSNAERIKTLIKTADIDWQDVLKKAEGRGQRAEGFIQKGIQTPPE